jgi:hypothetical protein
MLFDLLKKDTPLIWSKSCEIAFSDLKAALVSYPTLRPADPKKPFERIDLGFVLV